MSEILKDDKGYYKLENGHRRKLVIRKCIMCGKKKLLRPSKVSEHCIKCAYTVNAFKINSYIVRPSRNKETGKYEKGNI